MDLNKEAEQLWNDLSYRSNIPEYDNEPREEYLERLDRHKVETILQSYERVVEDAYPDIPHDDYTICGKCGTVI